MANQPVIGQQSFESQRMVQEKLLQSASNRHVFNSAQELKQSAQENSLLSKSDLVGQDLWKQLKRVTIPTFSGDKRTYQNWKAAFMACIDKAPATAEYKLLQLRQCLTGEDLESIESLG